MVVLAGVKELYQVRYYFSCFCYIIMAVSKKLPLIFPPVLVFSNATLLMTKAQCLSHSVLASCVLLSEAFSVQQLQKLRLSRLFGTFTPGTATSPSQSSSQFVHSRSKIPCHIIVQARYHNLLLSFLRSLILLLQLMSTTKVSSDGSLKPLVSCPGCAL